MVTENTQGDDQNLQALKDHFGKKLQEMLETNRAINAGDLSKQANPDAASNRQL